jgi:hypothetical protein
LAVHQSAIIKWENVIMTQRQRRQVTLVAVLVLLLVMVGLAVAVGELLPRSLVSGGGGMVSEGGLALQSAIGQPVVGAVQNGVTLCSGFLCGSGAPPVGGSNFYVYLPVAIR